MKYKLGVFVSVGEPIAWNVFKAWIIMRNYWIYSNEKRNDVFHSHFICNKLKIFEFASVYYNRIPFMQTHAFIQNDAIPGGINNRKLHSFSQQLTHIAGNLYFGYMIKDTSEHSDLLTNVCCMYIHIIIGKYVF